GEGPASRVVDPHRGDVAQVEAGGCGAPAPVPVLGHPDTGKGADGVPYRAAHREITGAGIPLTADVAVHAVGVDALVRLQRGRSSRVVVRDADISTEDVGG